VGVSGFEKVAGGIDLDPDLFPQVLDRVERETASGHDTSGGAAESWATVYTAVKCLVTTPSTRELEEWAQKGVVATHKVWIPQQPIGSGVRNLPRLGVRDRMTFGTWAATGTPRYFLARWCQDVDEAGLLLEVDAQEITPA
jgi:hypothetical protein